jgi:hypothetical protein
MQKKKISIEEEKYFSKSKTSDSFSDLDEDGEIDRDSD